MSSVSHIRMHTSRRKLVSLYNHLLPLHAPVIRPLQKRSYYYHINNYSTFTLFSYNIQRSTIFNRRKSLILASTSTCNFSSSGNGGNGGRKNKKSSHEYKKILDKVKRPNMSLGAGAAAAASGLTLLGKSKGIISALKLTKFASLGSMIFTVGTYSAFYGFPYAAGMVGLILTHETGHALTMRQLNIPFSPMIFVPFLGASVAMKKSPQSVYHEALVALGGPVMGTAGAFAVWGGALATNSQLCYALADFGFMINLFNLIPVGMLDGGRIGNALSPYTGVLGVTMAGSMIYLEHVNNPIFYLITLAGGYQTGMRLWNDYNGIIDKSLPQHYYRITNNERMKIAGGYFGLIGVLFTAMAVNERYKKSPERLMFEQRARTGILPGADLINIHRDY